MSRSFAQALHSTLGHLRSALAAALLAGLLASAPAHAAGYVYQQHIVNAGVLVNGSDPAPYVFYVLNNRPDVRPPDMTLINPLASPSASPSTSAYWEVPLNSVSDSELAQYNVLYLRADGVSFGPAINEKLRRFVDNGGQLIVEYGAATAVASGLFTGTATGVGTGALSPPPIAAPIYLSHPIISQPYLLSTQDLLGLASPAPINYLTSSAADPLHSGEFGNIFSAVLVDAAGQAVSAAQVGAGQVVATTLSLGAGISVDTTPSFTQADLYKASAPDLKLLVNIISWSEAHPSENKTSHGNASSNGLASFSPAWQYPLGTPGTAPSGAAVWGSFVFVTDAAGTLHAFDAFPSENLTGTANIHGAEQVTAMLSQYPTTSYDEIWNKSSLASASVPTVAAFGGVNYVFVEKNDGTVVALNAVTGAAATAFTLTAPAGGPFGTFPGNAPAPTYYDGRLYAGQANGTLHVYDLNEGTSTAVPLDPNTVTGELVTAAPTVGTLADNGTNVLAAVVSTNYNTYSVLLGARSEPLTTYFVNGALNGYHINRLGRYDLNNIFADLSAVPSLLAYDSNGAVYPNATSPIQANSTAPNPQDPLFAITNNVGYYTDWDIDFASSVFTGAGSVPSQVNLSFISASSYADLSGGVAPSAATVSAPAIDRSGDFYYTSTTSSGESCLTGVHNAPLRTNVRLKFRFLIPSAALTDADGVDYTSIKGFQFAGAPVIDDQGNVYAAAVKGNSATVLCFRGNQQASAVLPATAPAGTDLTQFTISQGSSTIQPGTANQVGGQFTEAPTSLTFYNFGVQGQPGLTFRQVAGNLSEPQPVTATSSDGATTYTLDMRTNLAWYVTPFATTAPVSGLSLVGSSVFLTDGTNLYRLSTGPTVGTGKVVSTPPFVTPLGSATAPGPGTVGAPPSVGGGVMVVSGVNGIQALTRQVTVIADTNRILGVDGDGSAVWSVDATTRTDLTTNVSTKVAFSHPTALSQFALNDYLVADPGTNRCVRFDSGGNVQWELTRFQDPNGLLASGQPLTLSQPTSVVTRPAVVPAAAAQYAGDTAIYYLVADSGNDRVLEVADFTNPATGALDGNHVLTWVSHTGDRDGRHYRYGSAAYYTTSAGLFVAATVTNTRLGTLSPAGGVGPVSSDAPGGSLVVFTYPATVEPFNFTPTPPSDLTYTTAAFYAQAQPGGAYTPYTIRNPRFLQLYTPPPSVTASPAGAPAFDFLYADDNGAFDLSFDAAKKAFIAGPDRLQFTPASYNGMANTAFGVSAAPNRSTMPFVPTCIQGIGTDSQTSGANTLTTRRYLITQNYSQGELGAASATGKLGGEVFEVDVIATSTTMTGAITATVVAPVGGFAGNQTLSHPALTGPLTQPTFGVRLP